MTSEPRARRALSSASEEGRTRVVRSGVSGRRGGAARWRGEGAALARGRRSRRRHHHRQSGDLSWRSRDAEGAHASRCCDDADAARRSEGAAGRPHRSRAAQRRRLAGERQSGARCDVSRCCLAGLPERGWHVLRHSFGTHAAILGVNPWRLQTWMGHKRSDETMLYVNFAGTRILKMLGARGTVVAQPTALKKQRRSVQSLTSARYRIRT